MKKFSKHWKGSKKPKKQRKYIYNAPLHIRSKLISTNLSKELRKKYGMRNISVRKGDKVKIVRGQFKNKVGKIERVDLGKLRAYVEGIEMIRKDGTKSLFPIHPSNLMIIEMNLDDKKRLKRIKKETK